MSPQSSRGRPGNWKLSAVSLATSSQIVLGMEVGGELSAKRSRGAALGPSFLITWVSLAQ